MAKTVVTYIQCDMCLDAGEQVEAETLTVALDAAKPQSIDLCETHRKELVEPLTDALSGVRRSRSRQSLGPSTREIRDWARTTGVHVPDRGRVPQSVLDAFAAAH